MFSMLFGTETEKTILKASEKRDLATVHSLINSNADLDIVNTTISFFGLSPLHLAAENGHLQVVDLLISKNANVNEKEKETGFTPLHLAAKEGHLKIAEVLIAKGAEVIAKSNDDKTPLDLANQNNHEDMIKLLQRQNRTIR
jgi:ankyrin repeat protein